MLASMIAATGSVYVETTRNPGDESGLSDANTPRMMAIEAPAPTTAASSEAIITSFRRILAHPLKWAETDGGKRGPRISHGSRSSQRQRVEGEGGISNQIKW